MSEKAMSDLEKILDQTAHAIVQHGDINFVLRERLLPLLEAGQAMRASRVNISDDAMAWDDAKEKAME